MITAVAAPSVPHTMIWPSELGIRCLRMIRLSEAPSACAASTYSRSRSERNELRTIRARSIQPRRAMNSAMPIGERALGKLAATTIIATRIGTVRMTSTTRISTLSTHLPK